MAQMASSNSARDVAMKRRRVQYELGKAGLAQTVSRTPTVKSPAADTTATAGGTVKTATSSRAASRARRVAMSTGGKAAIKSQDRNRSETITTTSETAAPVQTAPVSGCGCGCKGENAARTERSVEAETTSPVPTSSASKYRPMPRQSKTQNKNISRSASLARRQAMSSRGKAALNGKGISAAQSARAANPNVSSRELAQQLREQQSKNGKTAQKHSEPTRPIRPGKTKQTSAAEDAPWKVGASETSHGQTVTGTMVGRSASVTGDEPSTCRAITGSEYLGADIFREFCQTDAIQTPRKVRVSPTTHGNRVSGNELGRSQKVTGNEPGTCKRVTGNEYVGANEAEAFCGTKSEQTPSKITSAETRKGKSVSGNNVGRSSKVTGDEPGANRELTGTQYMQRSEGKAPPKVGSSATLRGGTISGTMVGRSSRVTGDEPGSCRNVTGDDYIGQEQYGGFCEKTPSPTDRKVGFSKTLKGKSVTGTLTGRAGKVTGDEPGTCKAVTGTPYAGAEQYDAYCKTEDTAIAVARTRPQRSTPASPLTGQQPGLGGKMTGNSKGVCEPLTGTPYVGADQYAEVCPSVPADTNSPDYPQMLSGMPWGQFSVTAPNHASQTTEIHGAVTGTHYEKGHITGPFGMAGGKVTGTEEARFGNGRVGNGEHVIVSVPPNANTVDDSIKSRITGEGMDAGRKITGDDWDRGDNVTGTEGMSAIRRNPTRRGGPAMAMQQIVTKRNEEIASPTSKVTGGSGNTDKGALITYSGGARG